MFTRLTWCYQTSSSARQGLKFLFKKLILAPIYPQEAITVILKGIKSRGAKVLISRVLDIFSRPTHWP